MKTAASAATVAAVLLCGLMLGLGPAPAACRGNAGGDSGSSSSSSSDQDDGNLSKEQQMAHLEAKWGEEWTFSGFGSFAHLDYAKCLTEPTTRYDIAIVGMPFDTTVTYRPGARFGPRAIRQASARQTAFLGFNSRADFNPYQSWARIVDCGDVSITPFDNDIAREQMTQALESLSLRPAAAAAAAAAAASSSSSSPSSSSDRGDRPPRVMILGGDHSLTLPALRALRRVHGKPVRVLHFDAHLDTWDPEKYPSYWGTTAFTHGSALWMAGREGLLNNDTTRPSVHAGLRTRLTGKARTDDEADTAQNWVRIAADELDDTPGGAVGMAARLMGILGTEDPVYLSVDIDVLDPAFAPGTGTPEAGGWTTREMLRMLRGLEGLNLVGADVVEVAPAYQGAGEETALAAAQIVYELLTSMVKREVSEGEKMADARKTTGSRDEL